MARLIITVEGGKITQTLNFLDRNIKDNRYIYDNGNESGIMDEPEEIYADIPGSQRIAESYHDILEAVNLGKTQITDIMRSLNELEAEMDSYVIPADNTEQEHVITLNGRDMQKLAEIRKPLPLENDKHIEETLKMLIHGIRI